MSTKKEKDDAKKIVEISNDETGSDTETLSVARARTKLDHNLRLLDGIFAAIQTYFVFATAKQRTAVIKGLKSFAEKLEAFISAQGA